MNKMGPLTGIAGFCLTHESWGGREWMYEPFLNRGKVQATNGHILIQLDSSDMEIVDSLVVPQKHLDKISSWLTDNFSDSRRHDWRPLPDLPDFNPCDECEGSGKQHSEACECCDGYGERFLRIPFGDTGFCIRYLRLLSSFDGIQMDPDGENPCPFKFNGGIGLLMPMRDRK